MPLRGKVPEADAPVAMDEKDPTVAPEMERVTELMGIVPAFLTIVYRE